MWTVSRARISNYLCTAEHTPGKRWWCLLGVCLQSVLYMGSVIIHFVFTAEHTPGKHRCCLLAVCLRGVLYMGSVIIHFVFVIISDAFT